MAWRPRRAQENSWPDGWLCLGVGYEHLYRHNPHILGNYTKRTNFPLQQDIEPEPRFDMSLAAWWQICGASSRRGPWQINMDVHIRYESNLLRSIRAKDWMDPTTSQHNSRTNFADRLSLAAAKDCFQWEPWWWLNKAITCTDFEILLTLSWLLIIDWLLDSWREISNQQQVYGQALLISLIIFSGKSWNEYDSNSTLTKSGSFSIEIHPESLGDFIRITRSIISTYQLMDRKLLFCGPL